MQEILKMLDDARNYHQVSIERLDKQIETKIESVKDMQDEVNSLKRLLSEIEEVEALLTTYRK